jgi:hypothetical protein
LKINTQISEESGVGRHPIVDIPIWFQLDGWQCTVYVDPRDNITIEHVPLYENSGEERPPILIEA